MTLLLVSVLLAAAPPTEADRFFLQGKQLMKTRPAEACPLFERSYALDPALGTLLNLALCLETTGRFATAWLRFNQATEWATRTHEGNRQQAAREHAEALSKRLSWLALTPERAVPGLEIEVGPHKVALVDATSLPVDPGKVEVRASAPGCFPWKIEVDAPAAGETLRLTVPQLVSREPPPAPVVADVPQAVVESVAGKAVLVETRAPDSPMRASGAVLIVSGATVLAAGVASFAYSAEVHGRAQAQRVDGPADEPPLVSRNEFDVARTLYPLSVVAMGVGAAASAVGLVLFARAPAPVLVSAAPLPGGIAVVAGGSL